MLEDQLPYLFVDGCMQAWPDADFANAHRHGVAAFAVTSFRPHSSLEQALEGIMFWHLVALRHSNLNIAYTVTDIIQARREGKATLLLASQCGDFIADKLHRIAAFWLLGLRMLVPAYNASNRICGGALDRLDTGLTRFGQRVVHECNRSGLLLDCSHISKRASLDIIEQSDCPVVFSHSNVRAVVENLRNIDDEQIKACAARGGVIGLTPWGPILLKKGETERPSIADLLEHIDYVAQLTGSADNIGIGTDMSLGTYPDHKEDPWGDMGLFHMVTYEYGRLFTTDVRSPVRYARGFDKYTDVVDLITGLQQRGFSEEDVAKILGTNFVRVFTQVWK